VFLFIDEAFLNNINIEIIVQYYSINLQVIIDKIKKTFINIFIELLQIEISQTIILIFRWISYLNFLSACIYLYLLITEFMERQFFIISQVGLQKLIKSRFWQTRF